MHFKNLGLLSAFVLATIVSAHPSHFSIIKGSDGSAFEAGEDKCSLPSGTVFDDTADGTITLPCHESRNGLSKEFGNQNVFVSFDRFNENSGNNVERMILDSNDDKCYNIQIIFHEVTKDSDGSIISEKDVPYLYRIDAGKECANDLPDGLTVGDVTGVKVQLVNPASTTTNTAASTDPTAASNDGYNGGGE